ncbi:EAL domain-containing protein [Rivularia sp. PCC 7116]|uniref:caspase, EACC1-associated type n=1 Tax=Rivularia sp. PCC 7116 TaxID=373994 RepID=UPI00029EFDC5|nr:EAL domain-containing protein [Rivularia sp. PCC 7116]AFY56798.1 EAL domain-containing protein [Rivularia sp. PCC 7116]
MKKLALLIGVSDYEYELNPLPGALKDVDAMQRVLQHPGMGDFPVENIKVLKNPQIPNMSMEIEKIFSNSGKDDLVLLYFSGHGIKDDNGDLYLASSQTYKHPNGQLITSSTVPASFVHNVMDKSFSRRQVIILDCCFSGAFARGMTVKNDGHIDIKSQLGGEGRAVLTSSTSTQYSFEEQASNHSIYTRFLVEGIENGKADIDGDGVISVDELHEYTRTRMRKTAPKTKPEIYAFEEGCKIQLSKVYTSHQTSCSLLRNQINFGELKLGRTQQQQNYDDCSLQFDYLPNFLETFESFIEILINQLSYFSNIQNTENILSETLEFQKLESIREASEADFVFVLKNDSDDNCVVKSQSNLADNIDHNAYINILNTTIFPIISYESVFNPSYHGTCKINEYGNNYANTFAIIPLKMPPEAEIMVVCGLPRDSYLLGDAYGKILSSFYQSTQESLEPMFVEAAIIDALKKDFKFVSKSLYDRRFQLFCERLQKMVVYFEPVICIDVNEFFISGWEALARDTQSLTAPVDLFQAAELWGSQFKLELDQYFLRVAAQSYKQARKSKQRRLSDVVPLSVNVYPESLIKEAYFETVREVIEENIISPRNLILEISEKSELPNFNDGVRLDNPLLFFKNKLLEYVHKFNIRFAIDDFGVGHSSVSRLAGLNPCHVKIDREILHHQSNYLIINFVHQIVKANNLYPPNVIVEGVDEETPISLYQLKEIGVTYVQGHLIGKPEPEVYRLSQEKYIELQRMISGE